MGNFPIKSVVITGGSKGIGAACARLFYTNSWKVTILDTDESGSKLEEELGNRLMFIKCDVSKESQVRSAMEQSIKKFGEIDVLVNCAGIQRYSTVTNTTEEEWDLVMNVNLKSSFLCSKHAISSMQRNGKGLVVIVSSVQAFITQKNVAPYSTSKTAQLGLTRSIAVDYGPDIRSVAICPGTVDTPMFRDAIENADDPQAVYDECVEMHLTKRIGLPEEIAELIHFLSDDKATFMTGQAIRIDGGLGIQIQGSQ